MVPYQELLSLLRRREDELRSLREERTAKDATIDFLKTKIATLQNRLAVESLQGSGEGEDLQQSLETERRRNEEMSRELQHAALEIDDLRTELKEARAEVASLQAEMEKSVLHANSNENHNGVLKEHNVLIASVEELERELAQDTNKAPEVQAAPFAPSPDTDEGTRSLDLSATADAEEERDAGEAFAPSPPPGEEPAPSPPPGEDGKAEEAEEDSPLEAGEVHVSASGSGALLNFFDTSEDAAALEAKRQRVARQIERRRQARRQPTGGRKAEEAASRASSSGRHPATMELPLRRDSIRNGDDRAPAESATVEAEKAPEAAEGPVMEVRALSAVAPAGRSTRVTASSSRPGLPEPAIEGLGSPSRSGSAADTPTLHSKFEGLRDEMKRRRSQQNVSDPQETAEAVVAEAKTTKLMTFGSVSEVSPQASPPSVHRHVVRTRSGSPLRSNSQAGTPHSMSFTPLGRCFSAIQASPGGSVTLPSTPKRGVVIPAAGLSHTAGTRVSPSLSLFQPVVAGGSLAAPAQAGSRSLVASAPSPGQGQVLEDGGWRPSHSCTSPPGQGQTGYVLAQASPTSRSVAAPSVAYRNSEDVTMVLSSSAAVPAATPGELDRSRRSTTLTARGLGHVGSNSNLGSYTSRPNPQYDAENDGLHEAVQRFCRHHPLRFPMARLSRGVYLYGNKKLLLTVHNGKLLVRIGGGFSTLESCVSDADRAASVAANASRRSRASYG